jgi:hypothetical protein
MDEAQRQAVIDALPSEFPVTEESLPEGDWHTEATSRSRSTLKRHSQGPRRRQRRIYVAGDLPVYYPGEPMFAADLIAVLDVGDHFRNSWIVTSEGKGLDLAIEIHWLGHRAKDAVKNVERYARLGISEYFFCDLRRRILRGYRLPDEGARVYQQLVPQGGRFYSQVLDLELGLEGQMLRFFQEGSPVLWAEEIIPRLEAAIDEAQAAVAAEAARAAAEAERAAVESERAAIESERAAVEAERAAVEAARADEAERRLAEALAELEKLRSQKK